MANRGPANQTQAPVRVAIAPKMEDFLAGTDHAGQWLRTVANRFNVYVGAGDPTAAIIPDGQWIIYRNTTTGDVRMWTNIAGVLKKSAAFT
jgi:hypothetical protein